MWSRFDMQDAPPDILITNYTMMRIMLGRPFEEKLLTTQKNGSRRRVQNLLLCLMSCTLTEERLVRRYLI